MQTRKIQLKPRLDHNQAPEMWQCDQIHVQYQYYFENSLESELATSNFFVANAIVCHQQPQAPWVLSNVLR